MRELRDSGDELIDTCKKAVRTFKWFMGVECAVTVVAAVGLGASLAVASWTWAVVSGLSVLLWANNARQTLKLVRNWQGETERAVQLVQTSRRLVGTVLRSVPEVRA